MNHEPIMPRIQVTFLALRTVKTHSRLLRDSRTPRYTRHINSVNSSSRGHTVAFFCPDSARLENLRTPHPPLPYRLHSYSSCSPRFRIRDASPERPVFTAVPTCYLNCRLLPGNSKHASGELPVSGTTAREEVQACQKCDMMTPPPCVEAPPLRRARFRLWPWFRSGCCAGAARPRPALCLKVSV